jgi:hypothetical protein
MFFGQDRMEFIENSISNWFICIFILKNSHKIIKI